MKALAALVMLCSPLAYTTRTPPLCVCGHRRWEHVMVHRDRARPCSRHACGCAAYQPVEETQRGAQVAP